MLDQAMDELNRGLRSLARGRGLRQRGEASGEIGVLSQEESHEAVNGWIRRDQLPEVAFLRNLDVPLPEGPKVTQSVVQSMQVDGCLGPGQGLHEILRVLMMIRHRVSTWSRLASGDQILGLLAGVLKLKSPTLVWTTLRVLAVK
jgi:hypothetical protein